jgi:hypothetical protein
MKKLISILLALCFLIHFVGYYAYFAGRLNEIHSQVKRTKSKLPENQLTRLLIPVADQNSYYLESDEIEFQGKMYDVVRSARQGNVMVIFAIHDTEEDNLLSFIGAVVSTIDSDQSEVPVGFTAFFNLQYISACALILPALNFQYQKNLTAYFLKSHPKFLREYYLPPEA